MTTASTSLLGLALPVTGELSGTWGDTVNNSITSLLDSAIAGTTTITADADIVLSTTALATNESRQAIIKWATTSGTTTRNITAPAQSKVYIVINAATDAQSIVFRGVGPTTGVTIAQNEKAIVAWNGSDFVKVGGTGSGAGTVTSVGWTGGIVSVATATTTPAFTIAGTSGGIPYFNSATTWATSAALTQYGVLYGGGPGVAPATTSAGITGQVLQANTGGAPTWGTVVGTGDVVGPSSATNNGIALFDATTGKLIKNSSAQDGLIYGLTVGRGLGSSSTNTAFGVSSLSSHSGTGTNSAFGYQTLKNLTTAGGCTAVGTSALAANTTGNNNTAVGYGTLQGVTTGSNNTAMGWTALSSGTGAADNTAIGYQSMCVVSTGYRNTAVGSLSYANCTIGYENVAIGYGSLQLATGGAQNTCVGFQSGNTILTGGGNVAVGYQALALNSTNSYSVAIGYQTAYNSVNTGTVAAGYKAGYATTTNPITAIGYYALTASTGVGNTAVGYTAGMGTTTAQSNTFFGYEAGKTTTSSYNTAVGSGALAVATNAPYNTAVGASAAAVVSNAAGVTAVGYLACNATTTSIQTGVGYRALAVATGSANTGLGYNAGDIITTGTNNTIVGYNSSPSAAAAIQQIVIGSSCTGQGNNYVTIGTSGTDYIYNQFNTNATWTKASDIRIKKNIQNMPIGLDFLKEINVKSYNWKPSNELPENIIGYSEENTKDTTTTMYGLMAQEVKAAMDKYGFEHFAGWNVRESDGLQGVSTESFVLPLINAVKELSAQIESMKAEIAELKNR